MPGIYPSAFSEWHVADLDDSFAYDPAKSKELLAEAGFPDGITLKTPIMPAIQPHVELVTQMLGAVGITVEQTQINNGELGPRVRSGEWGLWWGRELLYHPAATYPKYTAQQGVWNPFRLDDMKKGQRAFSTCQCQRQGANNFGQTLFVEAIGEFSKTRKRDIIDCSTITTFAKRGETSIIAEKS